MHRGVHQPRSILAVINGEINGRDDFTYVLIDARALFEDRVDLMSTASTFDYPQD